MTDDNWREGVLNRLGALEKEMASLKVQSAVDEVHRQNVEKRLQAIEDGQKWLIRLILGAIVMAVMAFALSGGFST